MKPEPRGNWKLYYKEFFHYLKFLYTDHTVINTRTKTRIREMPEMLSDFPDAVILLARDHANTVCAHAFFDAK